MDLPTRLSITKLGLSRSGYKMSAPAYEGFNGAFEAMDSAVD